MIRVRPSEILNYLFSWPTSEAKRTSDDYYSHIHSLQTPLPEALAEISRRRLDKNLCAEVATYLHNDIPIHFSQSEPILYMARHVASPNLETLNFLDACSRHKSNCPIVIGQDTDDILVGNNTLKKDLVKMPLITGFDKNKQPIIEYFNIADFSSVQGKKFKEIETYWGERLESFHNNLITAVSPVKVTFAGESGWISRNHRGDLLEHYKKFLALMLVHGIMFELYEDEDKEFVYEIFIPAYEFVEKKFGVAPLITYLVPPEDEVKWDWNAYPEKITAIIKNTYES